ncbi:MULTISPECIES: aspartyl-phosphate phosphatase Spo0E family protein [unclassified Paenibacillus]|uniref:aspartyl-phosphate phosphatase Spo0E family protein n=1 Tax=unclassified Paenibacillus TaxID=185978 RepID=UPI0031197029
MNELEVIQKQIEVERARLNQMEQQFGLLHPSVIKQSMLLDELINKYTKLDNNV